MCTDLTCPTGAARASSLLMGVPPSLNLLNLMHPTAAAPPPPSVAAATSPYVCNWMSNGEFCGRRFNSSEDLMGHLRTHTSTSSSALSTTTSTSTATASTLAALQAAQAQ